MTDPIASSGSDRRISPGARLALFGWPGIGVLAALTLAGAWYGMTAVTLLGALVAGTGLIARGWAALALTGLTAERSLSGRRAFPGDTVTLTITLDNAKPLPLSWVRAEQILPRALSPAPIPGKDDTGPDPALTDGPTAETRRLTVETPLGWYQTATLTRRFACHKRGWYPLPGLEVASADVFGLFVRSRTTTGDDAVIVYPRIQALGDLGLPARHPLGNTRDPRRLFEDPSRPMGIREYGPETPFKAIHWKASARTGQLQATVFEPTVALETVVLLAADGFAGPEADRAFEIGVSAAASLAHRELGRRRAVGLYSNGHQAPDRGAILIPPGREADREMMLLEALARLQRRPTEPLAAFLDERVGRFGAGATLAVIADTLPIAALARLDAINRRGRPVVLLRTGDGTIPAVSFPVRQLSLDTGNGVAA
ncbi:DUF58 domain-containing protein [Fodinicurvata sp. EGI_FJ10296]|uniref:DUF58 domain-containing protein n=1 Tax=Fodinicurvata sp. EGI_FJ10296 TaxID=3231908 RepID=UPI0034538326